MGAVDDFDKFLDHYNAFPDFNESSIKAEFEYTLADIKETVEDIDYFMEKLNRRSGYQLRSAFSNN